MTLLHRARGARDADDRRRGALGRDAGRRRALRRDDIGRLRPAARADLVLLDAPSYAHLAYRPGVPLIAATIVAGRVAWATLAA